MHNRLGTAAPNHVPCSSGYLCTADGGLLILLVPPALFPVLPRLERLVLLDLGPGGMRLDRLLEEEPLCVRACV